MRALCLPGAVGELFHPFALCWLLPGAQGPCCTTEGPSGGLRVPLTAPSGQAQFGAAFVALTSFLLICDKGMIIPAVLPQIAGLSFFPQGQLLLWGSPHPQHKGASSRVCRGCRAALELSFAQQGWASLEPKSTGSPNHCEPPEQCPLPVTYSSDGTGWAGQL